MLFLLLFISVVVVLACWSGPAPLAPGGAESINTLEQIELNGVKQWISIRGRDTRNPVLLFLHGGPGSANLALLRTQCPQLEDHFVVVNWDQRGAGKTFASTLNTDSLSVEQMIQDAHQLVTHLKSRLGVGKIYLMGFSWGTALGLSLVDRYPEDFQAYISVSQEVNGREAERLSLDYVRQKARETHNAQALHELEGIDPAYESANWFDQLMTQRKWLLTFGGVYRTRTSYTHEVRLLLKSREYSLAESALWPLGSARSLRRMWPELMQLDFSQTVRQVRVPIYFFVGRHDMNTPYPLIEKYYDHLSAPADKGLVWFEDSAHSILIDQPDKIAQEIIEVKQKQSRVHIASR